MNYKILALVVFALVAFALVLPMMAEAGRVTAACRDGSDNDGDGYTDWPADPGCANKNDKSELNPAIECDDGSDNDGDSATDMADTGCSSPTDNDETDCGDGVCEGGETSGTCPQDCGPPDSCSDTDGGFVVETQGTVSGYYNGNPYSYTDFCETNTTQLGEYYCWEDNWYFSFVNCVNETVFSNGACV